MVLVLVAWRWQDWRCHTGKLDTWHQERPLVEGTALVAVEIPNYLKLPGVQDICQGQQVWRENSFSLQTSCEYRGCQNRGSGAAQAFGARSVMICGASGTLADPMAGEGQTHHQAELCGNFIGGREGCRGRERKEGDRQKAACLFRETGKKRQHQFNGKSYWLANHHP